MTKIKVVKKINDCVHGYIEVSDIELRIIDTFIFQRLRRIKQVSPVDFVFPGATHTRFAHSLGAMYLMDQVLEYATVEKQPLVNNCDERQKLRLVALLHDIGHYPLSHTGEEAVLQVSKQRHEDFGADLISSFLSKELDTYTPGEITSYILGNRAESLHSQLLSSDLDVDKLDYLLRDAYHAGVAYGQIDIQRIVRAMIFDKNNNMIFEKAGPAVENMLVGRYHLYQVVNQHRAVTAFEQMAERIYYELMAYGIMPKPNDLLKSGDQMDIVGYDDNLLNEKMFEYLHQRKEDFLSELIRMYLQRIPLKVAWESSRITDKSDSPAKHYSIKILQDMPDLRKQLALLVKKDIESFESNWLFPVSLKPIAILPKSMQIFVTKRGSDRPMPIEEDDASLFHILGKGAIYNARLYTKPGQNQAVRVAFDNWAKTDFQ